MSLKLEIATCNEWFVLKGEEQFGPFTYGEVIKLMQNKLVFQFDYMWAVHLESWTSLSELPEFSADRLNRLVESSKDTTVFEKRRHNRVQLKQPVYVHNEAQMWKGSIESLSEGGALILMENPVLLPGDSIHIHFKISEHTDKSFNCDALILNKKMTDKRIQHDTSLHYAVQFTELTDNGNKELKKIIQSTRR